MINPTELPLLVFAVSFLLLWVSERVGSKLKNRIEEVHEDFGVILTATLTLLGLILGFTFSMAVNRYDQSLSKQRRPMQLALNTFDWTCCQLQTTKT